MSPAATLEIFFSPWACFPQTIYKMTKIKTPDQRVRVFISSTIQELAPERQAAKDAISKLRLIPVLFEMGARPHPPQELYRAYLAQSHIFVGIYWNSYGWVAPGMDISGLEDEYRLSEGRPRLIYVKQPANERQDRLSALLGEIKNADSACYQRFSTVEELRELLENDLALLLSERFEHLENLVEVDIGKPMAHRLPVLRYPLIGREKEMEYIAGLLSQQKSGLITLTGPGGTGKTALALNLAHQLKERFEDGIFFIPLASVNNKNELAPTVIQKIGLSDTGRLSPHDALSVYLSDKKALLVLDNFEQIAGAALQIASLLEKCPDLGVLVTSRTPLHIRGERTVFINPLPVTSTDVPGALEEESPAVRLFLERALEVAPNLSVSKENLLAIRDICRKLDGLPLAIELAAAKIKFLPPLALLSRMTKRLDILSKGQRDLPPRQQTLRATIEWSLNLLDESARRFFRRLAVIENNWTLQTAESIAIWEKNDGDILELTEKLLDLGLIRTSPNEQGSFEPRFSFLQIVREYALEQLEYCQESNTARNKHAEYFLQLAIDAGPSLWNAQRDPWLDLLEMEFSNLKTAFFHLLAEREKAWTLFASLGQFWIMRGHLTDARKWIEEGGVSADDESIPEPIRAAALNVSGLVHFLTSSFQNAESALMKCVELYRNLNDSVGIARGLAPLGLVAISCGRSDAMDFLQEAIELSRDADTYSHIVASTFLTEALVNEGQFPQAEKLLDSAYQLAQKHGDSNLLAITSMHMGNYHISVGDLQKAQQYYIESLALFHPKLLRAYPAWSFIGLAFCQMEDNLVDEAWDNFHLGLSSGRESGDMAAIMTALIGISGIVFLREGSEKAAKILCGSLAMMERYGYQPWSATTVMINRVAGLIREESGHAPLMEQGINLTFEQMYALCA